ncbi:MAG: ABC transporter permease, partial [Lachnospiraceae bacterium]|nr:ABC transporter permease [Lachnospiraceae bacterium]
RYILKRILMMIPVLLGVTLLIFTLLFFADGDPARNLMGADATEEEIQELRDEWGLDDPYLVRYGRYLKQLIVDRDLGQSYVTKQTADSKDSNNK